MKARPIPMRARSIQDLLADRKTQTRRICAGQRELSRAADFQLDRCPHGQPGDLLWVREKWRLKHIDEHTRDRFTGCEVEYAATHAEGRGRWKPWIYMPRRASRLTLELTDVRVERLQTISDGDCVAEGVGIEDFRLPGDTAVLSYRRIWEEIHGQFSWGDDPWVWALRFRVHRMNVDEFIRRVTAHETGCRPFA